MSPSKIYSCEMSRAERVSQTEATRYDSDDEFESYPQKRSRHAQHTTHECMQSSEGEFEDEDESEEKLEDEFDDDDSDDSVLDRFGELKKPAEVCFPVSTPKWSAIPKRMMVIDLISKYEIEFFEPFPTLWRSQITVVSNSVDLDVALRELWRHEVLGFDTEWKPVYLGQISKGPHLLQLATANHAWLFPLPDGTCMPRELVQFLLRSDLRLVGFALKDDGDNLYRRFGLKNLKLVDLCEWFYSVRPGTKIGTVQAVAQLFRMKFPKPQYVACSDWSRHPLTTEQIVYAANDAWIAYRVWEEMVSRLPNNQYDEW